MYHSISEKVQQYIHKMSSVSLFHKLLSLGQLMTILFISFFFLSTSASVFAHEGDGPPFVKVNDIYAQTNPLFEGIPTEKGLIIPQDIAPHTYLVNTPIHLVIDPVQLGLDPSTLNEVEFR